MIFCYICSMTIFKNIIEKCKKLFTHGTTESVDCVNVSDPVTFYAFELADVAGIRTKPLMQCVLYAHGLLEEKLGWDILSVAEDFDESTLPEDGIVPCRVHGYDGLCTLYAWRRNTNSGGPLTNTGLVVANRDHEAVEYAKKKQKEKTFFI